MLLGLAAAACGGTGSAQAPTYRNPVFVHDAPDPTIIHANGAYYAYTTQSVYLNLLNIPILQSRDLVHWRLVGDAFPHYPAWVLGGPAGDMWAPHIVRLQGRYLLYYAGRRASVGDMAIGVGTADSPVGPFHDLGHPLLTKSPGQPPYTALDPFVMRVPSGRVYLYYGSDSQPIRVVGLSRDGLHVIGNPQPLVYPVGGNGRYSGLVEGAWVLPHAGWYYLMYSVGDCCSQQANYSVFVSRSRSPLGPFTSDPQNPILMANHKFWAVGHNATITDQAGVDWIVYHARIRGNFSDDRYLMLDRIDWADGWPVINDRHGPSTTPRTAPTTR